jgi:hypothetical protein
MEARGISAASPARWMELRRVAAFVYARRSNAGGRAMRTMLKVVIPSDSGNKAIKDGTLPQIMEKVIADLKPEAAYFTTFDGDRTAYFVFDMKDSATMPVIAEPFFMGLNARVQFSPVMNAEDLKTGLGKLR